MPRSPALLAGAIALLAAPLLAQGGPASVPRSVSLVATKAASVGMALPAGTGDAGRIPLVTAWNVNPAEPVSVTLVASYDEPVARGSGWVRAGGPNSLMPVAGRSAGGSGVLAARPTVVFRQPMAVGHARGSRSDDLPVRVDHVGTLSLVVITQ